MPAPLGPLIGLALGIILAWLADSNSEADTRLGRPRPEPLIALFAAIIYAPACGYFIVFAGDWSLAYLLDSRTVPSAIELIVIIGDGASVFSGFVMGRRFTKRRAFRAIAALTSAPLAIAILFLIVFSSRLRVDGTFHQVRSDFGTQSVAGGPLGYALIWVNAILVAGFAFTARQFLARRPISAPPQQRTTNPSRPSSTHSGDR